MRRSNPDRQTSAQRKERSNPDRQTSAQRKERSNPDRQTSAQRKERSNSDRQTSAQRKERSTPTAERCPAGEGLITPTAGRVQREKDLSLQPAGRGRGRRAYHSVIRPVLPAKGLVTPHRQQSLVGDLFGATRAKGRTPRFLGRETLEKPETASIITAPEPRLEGLASPTARITSFCGTFSSKSCLHGRLLPSVSATARP